MKTRQNSASWLGPTLAGGVLILAVACLRAQVPQIINYQGQVAVANARYDGAGKFKFALVNVAGDTTYWSQNGTSTGGSEPTGDGVSLPVTLGRFSVALGDTSLAGMTQPILPTVFLNDGIHLRVWFSDGQHPFERLTPDLRFASVGYALTAATVPDGSITDAKLAGNIPISKISGLPDLQASLAELTRAYTNYTALLNRLNAPPIANAGADQYAVFGSTITLDGTRSSDPNGNPLTYRWSLSAAPEGSTAALTDSATAHPSFVPDMAGSYTAQLVVNDGLLDSPPDAVTVRIHEGQLSILATSVLAIPQVVMDGQGNAMAGWFVASPSGGYGDVTFMVARYFAGATWGGATAAFELHDVEGHKLVMGANGTAWLVWNKGIPGSLQAKKFTPESGWGPTEDVYLAATGEYNSDLAVALNDQGNLVAAWRHFARDANNAYQMSIWGNTRSSSGWGQASAVSDPVHFSLNDPEVALDEQNQAMVVWSQTTELGALPAAWCNRFGVGSVPGSPSPVAAGRPGTYMLSAHLAGNRQGVAQVALVEAHWCPTNNNILIASMLTRRFTPGSGWGATEVMFEGDESLSALDALPALDSAGNAILTWVLEQPEDPNAYPPNPNPPPWSLHASYYTVGSGWGASVRLSGTQDSASIPKVRFDAQGNARIVWNEWRRVGPLYSVRVKEYTQSAGWNGPLHLIDQSNLFSLWDDMAVAPNRATVVVGRHVASGGYNIWANVMAQP